MEFWCIMAWLSDSVCICVLQKSNDHGNIFWALRDGEVFVMRTQLIKTFQVYFVLPN